MFGIRRPGAGQKFWNIRQESRRNHARECIIETTEGTKKGNNGNKTKKLEDTTPGRMTRTR